LAYFIHNALCEVCHLSRFVKLAVFGLVLQDFNCSGDKRCLSRPRCDNCGSVYRKVVYLCVVEPFYMDAFERSSLAVRSDNYALFTDQTSNDCHRDVPLLLPFHRILPSLSQIVKDTNISKEQSKCQSSGAKIQSSPLP